MPDSHSPYQAQPIRVLLVEDNPGDSDMIRDRLDASRLWLEFFVVEDGVRAGDFLARRAPYEQAPRPDLILLDLNLPRRNGWEVLAQIKGDENLRRIPVVVLTSSDVERDIALSYEHGANAYITKPVDFEGFVRVVNAVEHFWFTIVRLPPHLDPPPVIPAGA
ncbi:MAG: response regulator [Gemmatimonadales bacterium]|nr:response regulator [Gemmatimonadales bacterium]